LLLGDDNMDILQVIDFAVVLGFSATVMWLTWWWQTKTRNAGFVDIAWAACLAFAALYFGATGEGGLLPRMLTAVLGATWGFRLANHLLSRVLSEAEDGRYAYLRKHWQDDQRKFFLFFQGQALLVALFALPFFLAAQNPTQGWSWWLILGVVIWFASVAGESLADWQLARFRSNPKNRGKTCREGLWRYSRHPNYFFEWLHWFAYVCFAVGAPYWWLSLIGPAMMLVTLNWVTGIPFVEAQSLRSRGDDYREYQRTTSSFFPWFPKA
jgi:steroid 5-alpha reductase family enzyme